MCDHQMHLFMKADSILIDGAGCAVVDVREDGTVVYGWEELIHHFAEHEDMKRDADEFDEFEDTAALEWVDYNVLRGLAYMQGSGILPRIEDFGGVAVFPYEEESDAESDAEDKADGDADGDADK